ncbi:MAG: hypothetical protein AAF503_03955 [Pseudomonadota bacterium]
MVTLFPVRDGEIAARIEFTADVAGDFQAACQLAANNYDLLTAQTAIKHAELADRRTDGIRSFGRRGPYLLAWSPGRSKGQKDTLVLVADLSDDESYEQALSDFQLWAHDIQLNSDLWREGWTLEGLKLAIQRWADRRSPAILRLLGIPE